MVHSGERVISRDGKCVGLTTGSAHRCQMEGCMGLRVAVRWPESGRKVRVTYPCSKGMERRDNEWRIL